MNCVHTLSRIVLWVVISVLQVVILYGVFAIIFATFLLLLDSLSLLNTLLNFYQRFWLLVLVIIIVISSTISTALIIQPNEVDSFETEKVD